MAIRSLVGSGMHVMAVCSGGRASVSLNCGNYRTICGNHASIRSNLCFVVGRGKRCLTSPVRMGNNRTA